MTSKTNIRNEALGIAHKLEHLAREERDRLNTGAGKNPLLDQSANEAQAAWERANERVQFLESDCRTIAEFRTRNAEGGAIPTASGA